MGGGHYEYETESERIKRRLRQNLTTRQRLENWWHYHWHHVLIVLAAIGVMAYFGSSWGSALPEDYSVVWVGGHYLPDETEDALATALAAYGEDVNGDGEVVVSVRQVGLDLRAVAERGTSGQQEYADLMALNADLNCGQSTVFILEDPEAFQAYSGALLYLDGAAPPRGRGGLGKYDRVLAGCVWFSSRGDGGPDLAGLPGLLEGGTAGKLGELSATLGSHYRFRLRRCDYMVHYSNGQLIVRNMEHKDAQAIADAEMKQGWNASAEKYLKRLEDQKSGIAISLVAEYFGKPVGYINVYPAHTWVFSVK